MIHRADNDENTRGKLLPRVLVIVLHRLGKIILR